MKFVRTTYFHAHNSKALTYKTLPADAQAATGPLYRLPAAAPSTPLSHPISLKKRSKKKKSQEDELRDAQRRRFSGSPAGTGTTPVYVTYVRTYVRVLPPYVRVLWS